VPGCLVETFLARGTAVSVARKRRARWPAAAIRVIEAIASGKKES
jgi:hypothetical protein